MNQLLNWSIRKAQEAEEKGIKPEVKPYDKSELQAGGRLDPAIIDHILGKPDAVMMREFLDIAVDAKRPTEVRAEALEEFEMVCQNFGYVGTAIESSSIADTAN